MKRFFILLLLFSACKKDENFDFPHGKWEAYAFQFVLPFDYGTFYECHPIYGNNEYQSQNLFLEYNGGNKIHFGSKKGIETFKIKKVSVKEETAKTFYSLKLRNKKGKLFVFEYVFKNMKLKINGQYYDKTVLCGDFWIKGQKYFSNDAPNYHYGACEAIWGYFAIEAIYLKN